MLSLVLAALLQADAPVTSGGAIGPPEWASRATGEDLARVYPRRAAKLGIEGIAKVRCGVDAKGRMESCAVLEETPVGEGLGEAALKLMPRFRMRLKTRDGQSVVGGVVVIPIQFRLPR